MSRYFLDISVDDFEALACGGEGGCIGVWQSIFFKFFVDEGVATVNLAVVGVD